MTTLSVEYEDFEGTYHSSIITEEDKESIVSDLETSGCRVISFFEV